MLLYYQWLVALISFYVLACCVYNLRHMLRTPAPRPSVDRPPKVSILVPARNEERNIVPCLESLVAQDYPNREIIVLDDGSTDATAELVKGICARYEGVALKRGQPLPPEWHGKAWACHQLAQEASGDWLAFVDADSRLRPDTVSSAVALARANDLDLISLLPEMGCKSFGVQLLLAVIPFVFMGCVPQPLFTRAQHPLMTTAIGPFMLFRRKVYQRFGGHAAVRRDIVDDVYLARWVKRVGGRVALADGAATLYVEFYRDFWEAWRGLGKSAFAAFDYAVGGMLLALGAAALVFVGPYLFVYSAWRQSLTDSVHLWLPLLQISLVWLAMWLICERLAIPRRHALLIGLTVLSVIVLGLHSIVQSVLGPGVVWKERTYQFRPR